MKLGILQCDSVNPLLVEEHGEYPEMFIALLEGADAGFEYQIYACNHNQFPDSVHECDIWLITGSKHGAYEEHAWIKRLIGFIRDMFAAKVRCAGICFGHQVMAQALGGKVEKSAKAGDWVVFHRRYC